jgi:hypothetical protein
MSQSPALNDYQKAVISEALASQKRTMERAYTSASKASAIKAFCLRCVGYLRNEVRDCTARGCPLWTHRPYQTDAEE